MMGFFFHLKIGCTMFFYIDFLGCRLNEAEVSSWRRELLQKGHQLVKHPDDADIMVLNTCAVTTEASKKSRRQLRNLGKQNTALQQIFKKIRRN